MSGRGLGGRRAQRGDHRGSGGLGGGGGVQSGEGAAHSAGRVLSPCATVRRPRAAERVEGPIMHFMGPVTLRCRTGSSITNAERQRRYRERRTAGGTRILGHEFRGSATHQQLLLGTGRPSPGTAASFPEYGRRGRRCRRFGRWRHAPRTCSHQGVQFSSVPC